MRGWVPLWGCRRSAAPSFSCCRPVCSARLPPEQCDSEGIDARHAGRQRAQQVVRSPGGAVRRATSGEQDGGTECSSAITVPRETTAVARAQSGPREPEPHARIAKSGCLAKRTHVPRRLVREAGRAHERIRSRSRGHRRTHATQVPTTSSTGPRARERRQRCRRQGGLTRRGLHRHSRAQRVRQSDRHPVGPPRCGDVKPSPRSEDMRRPVPPAARAQTRGMAERSGIRARGPWARCGGYARDGAAVDARRSGCGGVRISPCPESRKGAEAGGRPHLGDVERVSRETKP